VSVIDDYLATLPAAERAAYERVCRIVREVVPDAEEATYYGMPSFKHKGKGLLAIRAAKTHLSVFPFGASPVNAVRDRLDGFSLSKGTIRFTPEHPLPDDVVADLVRARLAEIS
jgi:uncharacterized protein YdhG (YjbR/CyaY superfamily)